MTNTPKNYPIQSSSPSISSVKNTIIALFLMTLASSSSCKKNPPAPPPAPANPVAATLGAPANSSACLTGTSVDANNASINFTWNAAANTESYDVTIKDLYTQQTLPVVNTTTTSLVKTLLKNHAYSWKVVSKSSKTTNTATSDTWKFYLAGNPASNYAPFPANVTAPAYGANVPAGSVTIQWQGSDPDGTGDIASYDFYMDKNNTTPSTLVQGGLTNASITQNVTAGTYYCRVVTKDQAGNFTPSEVFTFTVQ